jgi:hypothetical protein
MPRVGTSGRGSLALGRSAAIPGETRLPAVPGAGRRSGTRPRDGDDPQPELAHLLGIQGGMGGVGGECGQVLLGRCEIPGDVDQGWGWGARPPSQGPAGPEGNDSVAGSRHLNAPHRGEMIIADEVNHEAPMSVRS